MNKPIFGIPEKHCDICGKYIAATPQWVYKLRNNKVTTWYCSYTCYKKAGGDGGIRQIR